MSPSAGGDQQRSAPVLLAGYPGTLAAETKRTLERSGLQVVTAFAADRLVRQPARSLRCIYFPFSPNSGWAESLRWDQDLSDFQRFLERAKETGISRVVLRSHAFAYGSSWKNYGLMEEDRGSLLPAGSSAVRWLQAEEQLWRARGGLSGAAIRLAGVLDPGEGDFIPHQFARKVVFPWAGHDPQVQFLSLSDAARALAAAAVSDETGIFNAAGDGAVPFRKALRAAAPVRIPIPGKIQQRVRSLLWRLHLTSFPGDSVEQIRFNWTVSSEKSKQLLGFQAEENSLEALRTFLQGRGSSRLGRMAAKYDPFGLDPEYLKAWEPWFYFLRDIYWRVEAEGLEHVPETGAGVLVSNHRGFMPFDGVIHRSLNLNRRGRHIRFLVIPSLFKFPYLSDFLIKQGGVVASQLNAQRLLSEGEIVGIFPEGIGGAFRLYKGVYQLGPFGKNAFARIAIQNQTPILPAVTVGHAEIFPILKRIRSSLVTRWLGWPYLPITPTFPIAPIPLPSKWHIRYLDPVPVDHLKPEDAENLKAVRQLSAEIRHLMQRNIDEMLQRRKHIFFGNIFDRSADGKG